MEAHSLFCALNLSHTFPSLQWYRILFYGYSSRRFWSFVLLCAQVKCVYRLRQVNLHWHTSFQGCCIVMASVVPSHCTQDCSNTAFIHIRVWPYRVQVRWSVATFAICHDLFIRKGERIKCSRGSAAFLLGMLVIHPLFSHQFLWKAIRLSLSFVIRDRRNRC